MIQTVLGEIYYSFTRQEIKLLDQYLLTSNWQYSETIIRCHACLMEFTMNEELGELNKEILFRYIYEDEPYNDSKLRFLLNRLSEAIREFQLLHEFKNDNVFTQKVWMDYLVSKKLRKNIQYDVDRKEIATTSEYRFLYKYFKSQEENFQIFNFSKDIKTQFDSIVDIMKRAELFSDLVFLKNYCSMISFTNVYQSTPFDLPVEKLNEIREKQWELEYIEFAVYLSFIDLLLNKNDIQFYSNYKKLLFDNFEIWDEEEKVNFLAALLNFSTSQINKGVVSFIDEQYNLFIDFEAKGIFLIKSYINSGRINNVIHIYLRKKEFKKAENFISKYIDLLEPEMRDSCRHFNLARILFENSKFKESLRELLQVDFIQDPFYSLNSKLLLLKNYFELKEYDAFDSLCASFKEYIRKNKVISMNHKTYYLSFIKLIQKIFAATPSKLMKLHKQIESETQLAEKNWLLEKTTIK